MKGLLVVVFLLVGFVGIGQNISFMKSYGNSGYDYGRDVKQTLDTGYICTGSSSSFYSNNADAFLLKTDSLGNFKWSYNYGGPGSDWSEAVLITNDSAYALAGYTNSYGLGGFDFYLVRTDINGVPLWERTYGGADWDKAFDMVQLADSGFVLVGETQSFGAGGRDGYIIRTNKFGDTLWTRTYGGLEDDYFNAIYLDGDSIVVVGGTESFGAGMSDGLIIKYNIDGTFGWDTIIGQGNQDYFTSIDGFGSYYMIGGSRSYDYANFKEDMWVLKIENDASNIYFDEIYPGSTENDGTMDLYVKTLNQDIIYTGYSKSWGLLDGYGDIFLTKYGSTFFYVISYTYGEALEDKAYAIDETYDQGSITIADFNFGSTGGNNFALIKTNNAFDWVDIFNDITDEDITLEISDEKIESFNLYPTVVQNNLSIEAPYEIESIVIYDMNGHVVLYKNLSTTSLDLSSLESGVYVISITSNNNVFTQKIIKE